MIANKVPCFSRASITRRAAAPVRNHLENINCRDDCRNRKSTADQVLSPILLC
jgi:hypothetical protein